MRKREKNYLINTRRHLQTSWMIEESESKVFVNNREVYPEELEEDYPLLPWKPALKDELRDMFSSKHQGVRLIRDWGRTVDSVI